MANLYECKKKGSGGGGIEVDHITITSNPTKTSYAQYDALDLTGIAVSATFTDGVTAVVTSAIASSPAAGASLDTAGTIPITISYGGATASFNVTVTAMTAISVTTMPTKTTYAPDEYLDLTGIVVTGTAGALSPDITSGCTFSPADGTQLTTEGTIPVTVTYLGLTTSFNVTCAAIPASLEAATWAQIKAALNDGTITQFAAVGDTKTIIVSGNTYHMQLASINDGTGTAGAYYPAKTADFISVETMPYRHNMNSTNTNAGGWKACEMRTYLNSTVYALLPQDLKDVIVEKTHMYTQGNQSTSFESVSDKLWLPTEWECFGLATYGGESATYNNHYAIFPDANSRKKTQIGGSSANAWWESSPYVSNTTGFCNVYGTGGANNYNASNTASVALCLRIG